MSNLDHSTTQDSAQQDGDHPQFRDIVNAFEPLFDVVRELARENATLREICAQRMARLEQRFDELQRQDEELLYRKFLARYYSEGLCGVRLEFETEIAQLDRYRRVLLDLVCYLPDAKRLEAERLLSTRAPRHVARRRNKGAEVTI